MKISNNRKEKNPIWKFNGITSPNLSQLSLTNWNLHLNFKVNEYISASLITQLIYDRDIKFGFDTTGDGVNDTFEPRVQFKELFGIGFSYNF